MSPCMYTLHAHYMYTLHAHYMYTHVHTTCTLHVHTCAHHMCTHVHTTYVIMYICVHYMCTLHVHTTCTLHVHTIFKLEYILCLCFQKKTRTRQIVHCALSNLPPPGFLRTLLAQSCMDSRRSRPKKTCQFLHFTCLCFLKNPGN